MASEVAAVAIPHEPLGRLFVRFLRFGALAWGGPVVQIAMLRHSFVDEERWVTSEQFNRVLALYQVLPGPEAHELCVYFGMLSRGRIGGMLAGLGFMLPGFILMFLLSWLYVRFGLDTEGAWALVFASVQAAVAGVIVRAVHRIGSHVVKNVWLWTVVLLATAAQLLDVHFGLILVGGGLIYLLADQQRTTLAGGLALASLVGLIALGGYAAVEQLPALPASEAYDSGEVPLPQLFWAGLKAGALTFGGAYTVIPFLQQDAVYTGGWMSNEQFLDGVALGGLLPAPLIIFATFVGYLGGGAAGAIALTAGIFLPAFALTLAGHHPLERLIHQPRVRGLLDGVTAAVVGLIAGTAITLCAVTVTDLQTAAVFLFAVTVAFISRSKLAIPLIVTAAITWGLVVSSMAD
jgi:chromate transporter